MLSDNLNATHARWRDGILSHQIVDVRHIPGRVNLVGDGLSRKDENLPYEPNSGSSWSVMPDWEAARGLEYDLLDSCIDIAQPLAGTLRKGTSIPRGCRCIARDHWVSH
jgi:hypothetical protein